MAPKSRMTSEVNNTLNVYVFQPKHYKELCGLCQNLGFDFPSQRVAF
jgi:hypothetical protein